LLLIGNGLDVKVVQHRLRAGSNDQTLWMALGGVT
jgi:hypothetical protein